MFINEENIIETRTCPLSGEQFVVTDVDKEFYGQVSPTLSGKMYTIPFPTLSPNERVRRRMAWRNDRKFYHRKCDLSGKQFISTYDPDSPYTVYEPDTWYSDAWGREDYAQHIDLERPFFDQFNDFALKVPRIGIDLVNCENSDFCNYCGDDKDCYLDIAGEGNYRSFYNLFTKYSEFCVDTTFVYSSKNMYESLFCYDSSLLQYCMYAETCNDCLYCFDIKSCSDCMFCTNLRGKKFHIYNKEYSPEEYRKLKEKILSNRAQAKEEFFKVLKSATHRDMYNLNSIECTGNNIHNSKNCLASFNIKECEESKYLYDVLEAKHCQDLNYSLYHPEWSYELISTLNMKTSAFCSASHYSRNIYYCDQCNNSQNLFACIGLNHGEHSIFNKQYSAAEYESELAKLIDHMIATKEWGEFFPASISPFGYNETVANEYMPLKKEEVQKKGWKWKEDDESSSYHGDSYEPLDIREYDERVVGAETARENVDACLKGILVCEETGRPFKIIKQELAFYIENSIPLPKLCPDQRHIDRMNIRNPRNLWNRNCSECSKEIQTSYSPDRSEKVLCEACYEKEIY